MREASRKKRGLRLIDSLILIGAATVSLAYTKAVMFADRNGDYLPAKFLADLKAHGFLAAPYHILYAFELAAPTLLALTLALLPIGLIGVDRHRAWRRPGTVACGASWIVLIFESINWGLLGLPRLFGSKIVTRSLILQFYPLHFLAFLTLLSKLGDAILVAWLLLALSGRWRAERDWIDLSGRVLGALWIVQAPLFHWSSIIKN